MTEVFHEMVEVVSEGVDETFVIAGPFNDCVIKVCSLDVARFPAASVDSAIK